MRYKFLTIAGLAALGFASCKKDFLVQSNPNSVTIPQYYSTESDILLAVNGIYTSLRSSNNIGEESDLFTDQRSDDTGTNDNQSSSGEPFQFNNYSLLPTNSNLKSHWTSLFNTITRCNAVLTYIDQVPFANASNKTIYSAEAKFVRAVMYFHLVRKWGDVPLVTRFLKADELTANTFRVKRPQVYKQIVADLRDAAGSNLPATQTDASRGRATIAAADAILGQVYLTMSTIFDSAKNNSLDSAKYYLEACYKLRTFGKLSEIPYADVFDVTKKNSCPELIWQIVNIQGDLNYHSNVAADNQAKGEFINSLKKAGGAGNNVTHDLVNEFESNDLRKTFSMKFANDPNIQDWFVTKYRDSSSGATDKGYGGNNWPLIRYADVILMLAEVNMYQGNNDAAIQYLNLVRERAKLPSYEVSLNDPFYASVCPTLKKAILHERRVELAFEHHRLFDLLRFFTIDELVDYMHAKKQSDFGLANLSNFTRKDEYFPIPLIEYNLDPVKMYQNPGY
ncbi:RagB/SusD family nutrient uptake outer membrane protein [Deminuibacter soli]|uniref:RagB/SusD family nutrient uptake outer membrane protein n=1 Tax=Deminuibacter soli TaxID=2291815 RepID=A0A3E1NDF6_9BACT|nr:RagB/SusD family nutrient uptake outer membrane protein [Deminuibacter soli]RFM26005.1 RagB/SusD family nutrient uptake outer membrane protein [Deminuibacter soli]